MEAGDGENKENDDTDEEFLSVEAIFSQPMVNSPFKESYGTIEGLVKMIDQTQEMGRVIVFADRMRENCYCVYIYSMELSWSTVIRTEETGADFIKVITEVTERGLASIINLAQVQRDELIKAGSFLSSQ